MTLTVQACIGSLMVYQNETERRTGEGDTVDRAS